MCIYGQIQKVIPDPWWLETADPDGRLYHSYAHREDNTAPQSDILVAIRGGASRDFSITPVNSDGWESTIRELTGHW